MQMMSKLSNCYVGTQSEDTNIGATNCAGLILHLLVPQSSSKPCRKETTPYFPNLHCMVDNLHEGLCREFVSNNCKTYLGLVWLSCKRLCFMPYGTSFSIYSNSDDYHSESLSMACHVLYFLLKSSHVLMFAIDYSLAPTHGSAIHPPQHLRQFLLPHLRFHLL